MTYRIESEDGMLNTYLRLIIEDWTRRLNNGELSERELERKEIKRYFAQAPKAAGRYGSVAKRIHAACAHRAMYVTAKGYIGLAPWNASVGDEVVVAPGGKTPFLIQKSSQSGRDVLVGETYLYGIMGGEALAEAPVLTDIHLV